MLDDLKYIHTKDASDALGIVGKQAEQLQYDSQLSGKVPSSTITNVVYAGMGGSALAASLVQTWPGVPLPFEVVRQYELPGYVSSNTLVIAASYSGNTEEVLSMLSQAEQRGASIAVIAAGGKLEAIAQEKGYLLAVLPKVVQARYAVLYNFRALLDVLVRIGLLKNDEIIPVLGKATKHLGVVVDEWQPIVPTARNPAKQLAQELLGKSVVTYGGPKMFPAAYKWKTAVNENAKQLAWAGCMPEYNHSEFIGWSKQPIDKPYAVVELRSSYEHPRVQKRFVVSNRLLSGVRPEPLVVESQGANAFEHLLYLLAYGDFVTLYLGLLNGLDPTPVALVENLKKEMDA